MKLSEFLKNHTKERELCIIRNEGWITNAYFIDDEDLFLSGIPDGIRNKEVKKTTFGLLDIFNPSTGFNDIETISVRYVDI